MSKPKTSNLATKHIRTDGGTQTREEINESVVADYAETLKAGIQLPAAVVFHDGTNNWLADGFHRYWAACKIGKALLCEIRPGTRRDAVLHAAGANAEHGLRRTNETKRRAVMLLLNDEEWRQWSDRVIAEKCGVSNTFVGSLRPRQVSTVDTSNDSRRGADGKQYPAQNGSTKPNEGEEETKNDEGNDAEQDQKGEETDEVSSLSSQDEETPEIEPEVEDSSDEPSPDSEPSEDATESQDNDEPAAEEATPETESEPAKLTVEEQIEALPLLQSLSLYKHAGQLFRQQGNLWHTCKNVVNAARAKGAHFRYTTGPVTDALNAVSKLPDPATWEGCASCKGSCRVGERNDPCPRCKGGFTIHEGEGVGADVVRDYAESL